MNHQAPASYHHRAHFVFLLTALAVVSCGSNADSGSGGGAASASEFSASYCELYRPCCASAGLKADDNQCKLFLSLGAAQGTYKRAQGEKCLAAMRSLSKNPAFCKDSTAAGACDNVFEGKVGSAKPGDSCKSSSDCAPSAEGKVDCASKFVGRGDMRKCQIQVSGKAGDGPCVFTKDGQSQKYPIDGPSDILAKGFYCDVSSGVYCDSKGTACKQIPAVGAACDANAFEYGCVTTGYCDRTKKICVERKAVGTACASASFFGDECAVGAACDTMGSKTCKALKADGAACTQGEECVSGTCLDKSCDSEGFDDLGPAFLCSQPN